MKIKLNDTVGFDADKLIDGRALIQANSGGGKSMTIRRFIEQAFGHKQIIVLDPEGEFTNLREKFDFVYAGKGGDAPAEPRSAELLARRLLELKASAIIDLYELVPQERKRFVRIFLEALVNAPKELWHDCFIILDEAHVFAPEKSEAESLNAVVTLASLGRKRGYCLIAATQRPAKLHKDVAAECNNKLIGRASLDIDRKRAAEELGFTSKEQVLSLRDLEPGEFYAFGPAISKDVVKIRVAEPQIKPPTRSTIRKAPPPPSARVKQILGQLADLPKEAEQEAATVAELKKKIRMLEIELKQKPKQDPDAVKKLTDKAFSLGVETGKDQLKKAQKEIDRLGGVISSVAKLVKNHETVMVVHEGPKNLVLPPGRIEIQPSTEKMVQEIKQYEWNGEVLPEGEHKVLTAIAQYEEGLPSREPITTITGYKRSTRDAYMARLQSKGLIFIGATIKATAAGIEALGPNFEPLPTGEELFVRMAKTLPEGEARVLAAIHQGYTNREDISNSTGYKRSTRDAYIARLANRQLVETTNTGVHLSELLK